MYTTTKIDIPGAQSICYHEKINGKDFFRKEYKGFMDMHVLEAYHTLQNTYAGKRYKIQLTQSIFTNKGEVNSISLVVLPLRDNNGSPSYASGLKEKKKIVVSSPYYIGGDILSDYLPYNEGNSSPSRMRIAYEIKKSGISFLQDRDIGVCPVNIKVISIKNGIIYLVITDLAMNIPEFVNAYEAKNNQIDFYS